MPDQQPQTLSIPSLLLLAAFAAVTIRYFFFPSSRQSANANPSSSSPRRAVNPADVEQVASMFPQIGRREIMWDLQRNGGSVGATTERILSSGRLDMVGRYVLGAAWSCLSLIEWDKGGWGGSCGGVFFWGSVAPADVMIRFVCIATAIFSTAYHSGWRDAHDCEYESRTDEVGAH